MPVKTHKKRPAIKTVKFASAKKGPNDVEWEPDNQYECDTCKAVIETPRPLEPKLDCPSYRKGVPCEGTLVRFGKGAGRGAHFKKEAPEAARGVRRVPRPVSS